VENLSNLAGKRFKIYERKSSKFGTVGIVDRGSELSLTTPIFNRRTQKYTSLAYYNNLKRKDIYKTALDKYVHDELARPIVNVIVYAIFSEDPDFQGDSELVDRANKIISDSKIDWSTWGADLEVHGDTFIRSFLGANPKIASIPAQTIDIDYDENNIIDIKAYVQNYNTEDEESIDPEEISHVKINNTNNMVYGSSTLRPCFWWLDVKDNLWERNWIRAAQYYGSPIISVVGVPSEHIAAVKAALQADAQRPGRNWVFPEGVKAEALDFTKNYDIKSLVDRVYQYILSACNIPQHLVYESDSSRGVAMFSGDAFEMMIKSKQKTWELGLLESIKYILTQDRTWKEDSKLSIKWAPVFTRDLKNLANLIKVGMEHGLYSKKSARETIRLDHSEEVENIKKQVKEEPQDVQPQVSKVPPKVETIPEVTLD
jgi:hypothetical protein